MPVVPTELQGGVFCNVCFDSKIQPQIEAYDQDVERTKDILIFMKKQTKETRHVKRTEVPYRVENCADESETLMRMAYMAMKAGFNSVVDVEATGKKVKLGAYQTSTWTGVGLPAHMDLSKIPKDRSIAYNPN